MELDDAYFMKQALREAEKAVEDDEVPVGAVVVYKNQIISRGYNQTRRLNDNTAHAEIIALTAAFNKLGSGLLDECSLYVTIEPCAMCAGAIKWARPTRLIYGAEEPKFGFSQYSPSILHPGTSITRGILREECSNTITEFFRKKRE